MTKKIELGDNPKPQELAVPLREIDPFPKSVMQNLALALTYQSVAMEGDILAFSFDYMLNEGAMYPCGEIEVIVAYPGKAERMQARNLYRDFDNLDRCAAAAMGSYGAFEESIAIREELAAACISTALLQDATVYFKVLVTALGLATVPYFGNLEEDGYHDINFEELIRIFVFRGQSSHQKINFLSDIADIFPRAIPFLRDVALRPKGA